MTGVPRTRTHGDRRPRAGTASSLGTRRDDHSGRRQRRRVSTLQGERSPVRTATVTPPSAPVSSPTPTSGPLAITGLTSNLASPQSAGTSITFSLRDWRPRAVSVQVVDLDGVSWTIARDWNSATTSCGIPRRAPRIASVSGYATRRPRRTSASERSVPLQDQKSRHQGLNHPVSYQRRRRNQRPPAQVKEALRNSRYSPGRILQREDFFHSFRVQSRDHVVFL